MRTFDSAFKVVFCSLCNRYWCPILSPTSNLRNRYLPWGDNKMAKGKCPRILRCPGVLTQLKWEGKSFSKFVQRVLFVSKYVPPGSGMQNDYESIMIMHVKKASVVQASLDIGQLTFPGLIFFFFFLLPRQQNNSLDSDENLGHSYIYICVYIYIHTHTHTLLNSLKISEKRKRGKKS